MVKIIETDISFLSETTFSDKELLKECVKSSEKLLVKNPSIILYGKTVNQPRNIGFFSDKSVGYKYSNVLMKSQPLTDPLTKLLDKINLMFGSEYNGILVNQYMDGDNYICAHSDSEIGLDNVGVIGISSGETRKFRIRDKLTKKIYKDVLWKDGQIIHMGGKFQKEFTHEIVKEPLITKPRISFTFRKHNI
jgi:alkylated DNA repair dioxygenase AlkB